MTEISFRPLPGDVDIQGMDFMPLYIERLMQSRAWLRAKHWLAPGPGLGFAMFNLWTRAFYERPAGSIDNDDDVLMDAAMVSAVHWPAMREAALKGWIASGARLHHPVVSEIVWTLWLGRLKARYAAAQDSHRAAVKRATLKPDRMMPEEVGTFEQWMERQYPATFAYMRQDASAEFGDAPQSSADGGSLSAAHPPDGARSPSSNGTSPNGIRPKRRQARDSSPPDGPPRGCGKGQGGGARDGGGGVWNEGRG